MERRAVVVGGGLGGLFTALLLGRAGYRVQVFERSRRLGGRGISRGPDGFQINLGPHALYPDSRLALAQAGIGFESRPVPTGGTRLEVGESLVPMIDGPWRLAGSRWLGARGKWQLARVLMRLPFIDADALASTSVEHWTASITDDRARALLHAYIRLACYCDAPASLSAQVAVHQLRATLNGVHYVDGGWQSLIESLSLELDRTGTELRTACVVRGIERQSDGIVVHFRSGAEPVRADAVVLALPPTSVVLLLGPQAPTTLRTFAEESLEMRAACLDLAVEGEGSDSPTQLIVPVDRPGYVALPSRSTRALAPPGATVVQAASYLPVGSLEDRVDPRARVDALVERIAPSTVSPAFAEYMPNLLVSSALPTAAMGGFFGRPAPTHPRLPGVAWVGDWVGERGLLLDAVLASAKDAVTSLTNNGRRTASA